MSDRPGKVGLAKHVHAGEERIMSRYQVDVEDADALEHWVRQISSGKVDAVDVLDDDEVVAVLSKPQAQDSTTPVGWIVAGHAFDDDELPAPFDSLGTNSNNVGASVWVELSSGAMIAAVPTGLWKEQAQFD